MARPSRVLATAKVQEFVIGHRIDLRLKEPAMNAALDIQSLHVTIEDITDPARRRAEVPAGRMVGLIGRNGAGKTTLMRAIMGLLPRRAGGSPRPASDLTHCRRTRLARLGISYMPEDRRLIPTLTVEENVLLPAWANGIADASRAAGVDLRTQMPEVREFRDRARCNCRVASRSWSRWRAR